MGIIKRYLLFATLVVVFVSVFGVTGQAGAAEPWWHVATISSPAGPNAGGEARVTLDVANLGDAATPGTVSENLAEALSGEGRHQVTVVDTLPAGVVPAEAHVAGGGTEFAGREFEVEKDLGRNLCSIAGQTVTCVYVAPLRAYEQILVAIAVRVAAGAGGGVNEVSVSGAGTRAVLARHALALEGPPSYGVQSYELMPEEEGGLPATQAGGHPFQLTTTLMLNTQTAKVLNEGESKRYLEARPVALTKDLRFELPQGLVGNPTPLPKCSFHVFLEQFSGGSRCPSDTVVGVASPILSSHGSLYVPSPVLSPVYLLEPAVGEPAKFGFLTLLGPVVLDVSVNTGRGYGVVITVPNVPSSAPFIGTALTLWGVPADARHDNSRNLECLEDPAPQESGGPEPSCPAGEKPQPFLIMPTSCAGPPRTSVQADSWSQIGHFTEPLEYSFQNSLGEPYAEDGCNRLSFEPSISVAPDGQQGSAPTGLTVGEHVAQEGSLNPTGLAESSVRNTTVTLPAGVALNPSAADGLLACTTEQVGLDSAEPSSCPEASKVGTVEIKTPLLPNPLVGAAYLATQDANPFGSLIALYVIARDPVSGVLVKLAGQVTPNPVTGQLVTTFDETPQLPFEDFSLNFFGGSRAPLSTPPLCGAYETTASITPWSGTPRWDRAPRSTSPAARTARRARTPGRSSRGSRPARPACRRADTRR